MLNKSLIQFYKDNLKTREEENRLRSLEVLIKKEEHYIWREGVKYIDFSSNDYLGLSQSNYLNEITKSSLKNGKPGSGASRLLSGNLEIYKQLEKKVAEWKGFSESLFFASGYQANVGLISALADRMTTLFYDKLNHASLIDGAILSRAKLTRYPHLDYIQLEEKLLSSTASKKIIVSESIFSMDGDEADIQILSALAKKYDALLVIDDAHGSGIKTFNMEGVDIYMATFSKALGLFGGIVCTNSETIYSYLINTCRSFIYTTAPPPSLISKNLFAIDYIQSSEADILRHNLENNIVKVRNKINELKLPTIKGESAIIPIVVGNDKLALNVERIFLSYGIYALAVRPPTVAIGQARIRLVCQSQHTDEDLKKLFLAFQDVADLLKPSDIKLK